VLEELSESGGEGFRTRQRKGQATQLSPGTVWLLGGVQQMPVLSLLENVQTETQPTPGSER
jgi:hypothetical protein